MNRRLFITASVSLALAVTAGAFGAHLLKSLLDQPQLNAWQTGVLYHFIHSLGILALSVATGNHAIDAKRIKLAGWFLLVGIILFSGSLYLLSTQGIAGINMSFMVPVTPIGGLFFIAGWLMAAFSWKKKPGHNDVIDR